jgi:hypothetical protein
MNAEEEEEEEEEENPPNLVFFSFLLGLISCSVFLSFYFDIERFWVCETAAVDEAYDGGSI